MLRNALDTHHDTIKSSNMHETFMHYLSNHQTINASAKDIGDMSRDIDNGYRRMREVTTDVKTWKGMDANQFAGQKSSSQQEALMAKDANGNWAISRAAAIEIMKSPMAWGNIKDPMKPIIRARARGMLDKKIVDGAEELITKMRQDASSNPSSQHIDDEKIPKEAWD